MIKDLFRHQAREGGAKSTAGVFLVIEGIDGSGKGTQFDILKDRLKKEGYPLKTFDFPRYNEESSYFVRQYLNGKWGGPDDVDPFAASLFFALDRYGAAEDIKQALAEGYVVLANRFTGSNMAHQGTKFDSSEQRRGYFIWLDNLEFQMLKIPRPDLSVVLRLSASVAQKYIDQKSARNYTDKKRDIHEADLSHLDRAVRVYDDMCKLFPKDFRSIDCERDSKLLDKETIHKLIWESVRPLLPPVKSAALSVATPIVKTKPKPNPYVRKTDYGYEITTAGTAYLDELVTNSQGNVYTFTAKLSPQTIAAAMARLSRRGDDMRVTILDEFSESDGKDAQLLKRVITAYGDDSVQQLVGLHVVVEQASNLLTKKLEWGRLAAYLEQSTRYIYFDQKDADGRYKYHIPEYLDDQTKQSYITILDNIFDLYSDMVQRLTKFVREKSAVSQEERDIAWKGATRAQACDAIRPVLPVATKSTVGIFASGQALESLIMHLLSDPLPEAHVIGEQMLKECRKVFSTFLERVDINERGVAMQGYRAFTYESVKELAKKHLPDRYSDNHDAVSLTNYWPKNELDLVPEMLYEHSHLSLGEISKLTEVWPIDRRREVFEAYMGERFNRRHKPGRALEKAHYSWDLICDYGIFRDLQRHRIVDAFEWQELTPRYGYDVPSLVEDAGLDEQYEKCFDLSLELYNLMQNNGYIIESQYATLLGHKMRWKFTYNAREAFHLHELRTTPQGHPGYRKLVKEMHDKLAEVHPLMASAMKFVNKDEDPELTRLAAERYTQAKLKQLDESDASLSSPG